MSHALSKLVNLWVHGHVTIHVVINGIINVVISIEPVFLCAIHTLVIVSLLRFHRPPSGGLPRAECIPGRHPKDTKLH